MSYLKTLASSLILSTLICSTVSAEEAKFECITPVQSASNMEKIGKGDFSANILWKDVKLTPTSIGYGPSNDHQYELTIVDGVVYMAQPKGKDEVIVRTDPKPDEGAAMLQVSSPKAWGKSEKLPAIASFDDLSFEMDQLIEDIECGEDALVPFKITGHASDVTWSMDTASPRVTTSENQDVTIIGLYNKSDKKKYFMVRGYNIHPHVLMKPLNQAGHLRSVTLDEGAQVWLPVKK